MSASSIRWPDAHKPEGAGVYVRNELRAPGASADALWTHLVRARDWHTFYGNARRLRFDPPHQGPDLELGTCFRWWTFGVPVQTRVEELEPPYRLAWSGGALGSMGYHAWLLEEDDEGCTIITEETQRGLIPKLGGWFLRPRMLKWHQRWLEGLARRASSAR